MTGSTPLDHLPKKYQALGKLAVQFKEFEKDWRVAEGEAKRADAEESRRIREETDGKAEVFKANVKAHLFKYDGKVDVLEDVCGVS